MFCMQCGAKMRDGAKFCSVCGAPAAVASGTPAEEPIGEHAPSRNGDGASAADTLAESVSPTAATPQTEISEPDLVSELLEHAEPTVATKPATESEAHPDQVFDAAQEAMPEFARAAAPEPPAAEDKTPNAIDAEPRKHKKRMGTGIKVAIGVAVAAVLAAGGGAGYYFGIYKPEQERLAQEAYDAAHSMHAVTIAVKAEGWDTASGATRLPVHVTGTDLDGKDVDSLQFVDSDGKGIALAQGSYKLTVFASPIAADGTIYMVPDTTVEVAIDSDARKDQTYDISSDHGFELAPIDPAQVTDDQINGAYDYASKDKEQDSSALDNLKDAATAKRDEAVAAAARHVVVKGGTYGYEFDLPAAWDGRVKVEQDGQGNVTVKPINDPDHAVFSMFVVNEDMVSWGDGGDPFRTTFADPFGNKMIAGVDVTNWGNAAAATEWANDGHKDEISDFEYQFYKNYPPMQTDALNEIVSLQSGGKLSFEDFRNAVNGNGASNNLSKSAHEYIKQTIVPTIKITGGQ